MEAQHAKECQDLGELVLSFDVYRFYEGSKGVDSHPLNMMTSKSANLTLAQTGAFVFTVHCHLFHALLLTFPKSGIRFSHSSTDFYIQLSM